MSGVAPGGSSWLQALVGLPVYAMTQAAAFFGWADKSIPMVTPSVRVACAGGYRRSW